MDPSRFPARLVTTRRPYGGRVNTGEHVMSVVQSERIFSPCSRNPGIPNVDQPGLSTKWGEKHKTMMKMKVLTVHIYVSDCMYMFHAKEWHKTTQWPTGVCMQHGIFRLLRAIIEVAELPGVPTPSLLDSPTATTFR